MMDSLLSLEVLAIRKIAIRFYDDLDINTLEHGPVLFSKLSSSEKWEPIVKKKMWSIKLPLILQKKIIRSMRVLHVEIGEWKLDHSSILKYTSVEPPIKYVWKGDGTIDRLKTAMSYIQNESYDLSKRFQMARVYWFHKEAEQMWKNMPDTTRRNLSAFDEDDIFCQWKCAMNNWIALIKSKTADWKRHLFSHRLS
ncbi:hypothetical protein NPIL_435551 [Nephila pilipes]|uniref:Uncharacterized protein n=1 Tax=Nephila pilipes TaxID=299642 RepID=A0A8X6P8F1_NEPPI|nr:hypothetical protein NPIL_435551 [Nephila pilipes]